jgi:hypothetical protein
MGFQSDFVRGINSGFKADGVLHRRVVSITNAEIKTLRATPKVLVPAPGAGWFVEVVKAVMILNYGSNALTGAYDLAVEYATSGQDIGTVASGFVLATADQMSIMVPPSIAAVAAASVANNAVQLKNSGAGEYAGNAGADTTMQVIVEYFMHKTNL